MNLIILIMRYSLGSLLLILFRLISPKLRLRAKQERSFASALKLQEHAPIWYHCSSEGELEQIWPIVQEVLSSGRERQLIWFTSPSLLEKAHKVNQEANSLYMALLPLLCLYPNKQHPLRMKNPELFFMVRYDFFAELIAVGKMKAKRFILLSATFKSKKKNFINNPIKSFIARSLYKNFDEIYFSTKNDLMFFEQHCKVEESQITIAHDFRHGQILKRQEASLNLISSRCLDEFKSLIKPYDLCDRLILGSVWPHEFDLFTPELIERMKNKEIVVFIAPHKLQGPQWEQCLSLFNQLEDSGIEVTQWDDIGIHGNSNVILCQKSGLLCELYPFFGHTFIGGGHGRSVHSLLEPYWGGGHIYCGPKTQRSTEFDYVKESSPAHIHVVVELKDFYTIYKEKRLFALDRGFREKLGSQVKRDQEGALSSFCKRSDS